MPTSDQPRTLLYAGKNSLIYYQPAGEDGQPVLIKALRTPHPTALQLIRFNNEFEFTKDLAIDGIRRSIGQTRLDNRPALVLEYVAGQTLKQAFVEQRRPLAEFLPVAIRITQTLGELHQHHIIHRDINSHNILVNLETRQIKIIDLGLASRLDLQVQHLGNPEELAGTLAYLSPEQTGRMNRVVDYRTDLYSLGVTFYEALAGRLPFESSDPLALVHAHLAKAPPPITPFNAEVPASLAGIVMKLLAKNAEDRYQSAFGLQADLAQCLATLHDPAKVDFPLGQNDFSGQFHLPQKLYGRSAEIAALLAAFERAAGNCQTFILVAGPPGVGKSALVAEVHKPMTEKRGYFISGKFDQYQPHMPYAAFRQAFGQLIDQLLTEPEPVLQQWRKKLLAAVGGNGAVLTELVPDLEKIIGPLPAMEKLGGPEHRNRFNLTFQNFLQAITQAEHPLIIFIDDWQWADLASLELLKVILAGPGETCLLLIGAYREVELDQSSPHRLMLNEFAAARDALPTLRLENLPLEAVQQLIQDGLACSAAESQALTELVYAKTGGNAFFTRQFLQNLCEEGWLNFDYGARRWQWDIARIKAQNITDNMVELMMGRLNRLAAPTAHWLQLAACIGNEFDLQTLALIGRAAEVTALAGLEAALTQRLIIPLDDYYQLPSDTAAPARFQFLHDQVQLAAYVQIPVSERGALHLEIGRLLLAHTPASTLSQHIFDIVQHYQRAAALLTDAAERLRVAELNLQAADLAYAAAAFGPAQTYLEAALALMPADAWSSQYAMMLKLYSQLAVACSLTGELERLDQLFQSIEAQAHTLVDTAQVKLAKIVSLASRGKYAEAIDLGLAYIEAMGTSVNRNPTSEEAWSYLRETAEWLTEARLATLDHLPPASAEVGIILEVAATINGSVYATNMNLCFVFVSQIMRLCLQEGLAPWAPVTLITFALILSAALHDIPKARLLTEITMRLYEEKYPMDSLIPVFGVADSGFVKHRYAHLKQTLPLLASGVLKGLATGNFQFAAYCAFWQVCHSLFVGVPLPQLARMCQQAAETCQKTQMERLRDWSLLVQQVTLNLLGKNAIPWVLTGEVYDEQAMLALAWQINDLVDLFRISFYRAWLHYLFGQWAAAVELFQQAEAHLTNAVGQYFMPLFYFYDALSQAALTGPAAVAARAQILERIDRDLEQMEIWVRFAPMNHQHKRDLMEAEKARLKGNCWQAVTLYEKAILGARENEFLNEEALAYELEGKFWLEQGYAETAHIYLRKAQNLYSWWGAAAKVEQLQAAFSLALSRPRPLEVADTPEVPATTDETFSTTHWLDIGSLLKANQALAQGVQLADLFVVMTKILLENAGAERALILCQETDGWFIEASGQAADAAIRANLHLALSEAAPLALGIFNYVSRTGKTIVLANAAQDAQFGAEPYLHEHEVKSVLCLPVWHKSELRLVLYLENSLIAGAFTEKRLGLLEMLSGQMAISLENARMYDDLRNLIADHKLAEDEIRRLNAELEQRVAERTAQLETANKELEAFSYSVSHDLRAPLRAIGGYTRILAEDYRSALDAGGQRTCDVILKQTQRMSELIDDLLAFSRFSRAQMQTTRVDMQALAQAAFQELTTPDERSRIDFHLAGLPPARGDPMLLRQVWLNLLSNAIKFSSKRERAVIQVESRQESGETIYSVRDNGAGFDMQYADKLFGVFQRLHSDREFEGTGVGLAIVQRVIQRHGGRIWALGREDEGATFYFTLLSNQGS